LDNSRRTFLKLVKKARTYPEKKAQSLIADRNYAALDQLVIEHLLGKRTKRHGRALGRICSGWSI
jgi:IS1 family transposase